MRSGGGKQFNRHGDLPGQYCSSAYHIPKKRHDEGVCPPRRFAKPVFFCYTINRHRQAHKTELKRSFMSEVTITSGNFESEVLQSSTPVLLDFWADWCGPCKMIAPFVEQIAEEYQGRVKVGKINVDKEEKLAARHGVVSIPTLVVYKDGNIMRQQPGALPKRDIEGLFKDLI
jgi:thioredoxin 1